MNIFNVCIIQGQICGNTKTQTFSISSDSVSDVFDKIKTVLVFLDEPIQSITINQQTEYIKEPKRHTKSLEE